MKRLLALLALAACQPDPLGVIDIQQAQGYRRGGHQGPEVLFVPGTGTANFAQPMLEEFDPEAAMETLRFTSGFYRDPANEGYDEVMDHVLAGLREAGFGEDEGYELRVDERAMERPAWTPVSGKLMLGDTVLHEFSDPADAERCLLPVRAPSCNLLAQATTDPDALQDGMVYVTTSSLRAATREVQGKKPAAILSAYLPSFNVDPTGAERHLDAIYYGKVPGRSSVPMMHISKRSFDAIQGADSPEVTLEAVVRTEDRPLRTIIATITGAERSNETVALAAHVQEPGANDNATGVAGLLEGARTLKRSIEAGDLPRPRRSISLIWGHEFRQTAIFLETTERRTVAGISVDMIGASKEQTGAICLLERGPDPGALTPLPPDEHTPWGASEVQPNMLFPNGLAVIMRCALIDVGVAVGGWETNEHPWEGGSDHDVFLSNGIPAALFWHFTDFTYHTSLDQPDMVDPVELHRSSAALMVGALGVAHAGPRDLRRYVESSRAEAEMRAGSVELEEAPLEVAEQWVEWHHGARRWLAALCNGEALPDRFAEPR